MPQTKLNSKRVSFRRFSWPPILIFLVLTVLTAVMALALKALITGSAFR